MQRSIVRDTVLLTVIQMLLDAGALGVNCLLTARFGAEGVGVLTLSASFFRLLCMIGSGNAFLCVSRFVSEELGKEKRDPSGIFRICLAVSLTLSFVCAGLVGALAKGAAGYFLHDEALASSIRHLCLCVPVVTIAACLKGWCNALCKAGLCAAADAMEFVLRVAGTVVGARVLHSPSSVNLCDLTAWTSLGAAVGEIAFLVLFVHKIQVEKTSEPSLRWIGYLKQSIPVMAGSALTALLSAANDALVPVTLRQAGNSAGEALSQFGIFEAIILPTLFFPSTILCSLAGILVTEIARENAAGRMPRIRSLSRDTIRRTLAFAIFVTTWLIVLGGEVGERLGGGAIAGRMIRLLAPVVPFIYLEIVLESIIKGMGAQAFSSLNYLCEYVIRISIVLICIPLMGFPGIVISYYASNIAGNIARLIIVARRTGMRFEILPFLGLPLLSAALCTETGRIVCFLIHCKPQTSLASMTMFTIVSAAVYIGTLRVANVGKKAADSLLFY